MPDDRLHVDATLVRRLIAAQFPRWAELPIRPVEPPGWDNRTFRLGDRLSVRLPSHERYVAQVAKEHRWLPRLAPFLPLPIPVPRVQGIPSDDYPFPWSVYRWLPGEPASVARIADLRVFAIDLARFLAALQRVDAAGGPPAGVHNFFRGGPLTVYDAETRTAIERLRDDIDIDAATSVWSDALRAAWPGPPVWVHGDVATGNLLVEAGRLSAVIDFGSSGVGDPACDTAIAWTLFAGENRAAFRAELPVDPGAWARGRGWALWKALITLVEYRETDLAKARDSRRVIAEVVTDHQRDGGQD